MGTCLAVGVGVEVAHEAEGLVGAQLAQLGGPQGGRRQGPEPPQALRRRRLPRLGAGLRTPTSGWGVRRAARPRLAAVERTQLVSRAKHSGMAHCMSGAASTEDAGSATCPASTCESYLDKPQSSRSCAMLASNRLHVLQPQASCKLVDARSRPSSRSEAHLAAVPDG